MLIMSATKSLILSVLSLVLTVVLFPYILQVFALQIPQLQFIVDSDFFFKLTEFYRQGLPDVEAQPIIEIDASEVTKEKFLGLSQNIRYPIVVRNALSLDKIGYLGKRETWANQYSKDTDWLVCSDNAYKEFWQCKPKDIIDCYQNDSSPRPELLRGQASHHIIYNNPDMMEAMSTPIADWMPRGNSAAMGNAIHEMFFAVEGTNTPMHGAFGMNLFKQISGHKRWTMVDPKYSLILGFVNNIKNQGTTVKTITPDMIHSDSVWLKKVPRVDTILHPGDILVVPSWWGHTIDNVRTEPACELTIGVPERYSTIANAFLNSPFFTINAIVKKVQTKISLKYKDFMKGTKTPMAIDFLPLFEKDNALEFDRYLIRNSVIKATTGIKDDVIDEDW